ncbi:MAG: prepilin-type N-terminal cleavage/methylation domain-containing protein [Lachnospiraceae bacterium]
MKRNNSGFSLVEIIVVISILVVLVSVITPVYIRHIAKSKEATIEANAETLYKTASAYMVLYKDGKKSYNISQAELGEYISGSIQIVGGFQEDSHTPVQGANEYGHKLPSKEGEVCIHYIAFGGKYDAAGIPRPVTQSTYVIEMFNASGTLEYFVFD